LRNLEVPFASASVVKASETKGAKRASERPKPAYDALMVAAAAFVAYLGVLQNGFVYDARFVVLENPIVRSHDLFRLATTNYWGTLLDAGLYRPLTLLSFGLQDVLGSSSFGYHLVDIVLHAVVSVLVVLVARSLGGSRVLGLAAGLLFALHPIQTEAVASIVGRAETLALLFGLGALLLYVRRANRLWVAALLFLALCSKESAVFALVLFPLHTALFERRPPARCLLPLGTALGLYLVLRVVALGGLGISGREITLLDNPAAHGDAVSRVLTALALSFEYGRLVIWPARLSADYSFNQVPVATSLFDVRVILGVLLVGGLLWLALTRVMRNDSLPAFGALAFVLPLFGFLHLLFPLGTMMAERLLYLPMFGVSLLAGAAVHALFDRNRKLAVSILTIVLVAAAVRVGLRTTNWRDDESLFRKTVETSPKSARSHFLLGAFLLENDRFAEAASSFRTGLDILPEHVGATVSLAQARVGAGQAEPALDAFEQAVALMSAREPDTESRDIRAEATMAALTFGRERARRGELESASRILERGYRLAPSAEVANELGAVHGAAGNLVLAERWHERALELDADNALAWNYLGVVAERNGDLEKARERYARALELDGTLDRAVRNLASLALNASSLEEAESLYRRAIELAPESYEAYNGLGITLARRGLADDARRAFERAIAIAPDLPAARQNLALLDQENEARP
jgi:Flp pilus assembly protein TadD